MIGNIIYRESLKRVSTQVPINDGTVLVTGATGLIGSCIIDLLMIANEQGRHFDIFALGRNETKLRNRFNAYRGSNLLHFIVQDIRQPLNYNIQYDYIIHGASNADPRNYATYPAETMLINIEGAKNVLEYCRIHKETKVLLMSTFEVYGNAGIDIYKEINCGFIDINQIRSCYPESKRCMEIMTRCYIDEYSVKAIICRFGSIYGPTMSENDSKAHAQFIRNGLNGENIVLKSKGEQKRTYCYVIDAVTGLLTVLGKGCIGDVYNVAYENAVVSIAEVAHTVAKLTGTKVIMAVPNDLERKGYSTPQNCILDNSKLKSLGWVGYYDIDKGIEECLSILRNNNQINR